MSHRTDPGEMGPGTVSPDAAIQEAMLSVGFSSIDAIQGAYELSTHEIRHFLSFERRGPSKQYVGAVYGFGNPSADNFAIAVLRESGGPQYQHLDSDVPPLRFSFGIIAKWEPRGSIDLDECPPNELKERLSTSVRAYIDPLVLKLRTSRELFDFLVRDDEPYLWGRANGAVRASQIVYMAAKCGMRRVDVEKLLEPFQRNIKAQISNNISPDFFLGKVFLRAGLEPSS